MATAIEPITLPWKRPERGVSAAELGANFRVEQREEGWHCTVTVDGRRAVLATGMKRLRDAQCRAEAHAATMPEVAAALAAVDAAPEPSRAPDVTQEAAPTFAVPTFEVVSDGCICGKIETGTWIADPTGKVSVPTGTDPALAQEICRVAATHYTAKRARSAPTSRTKPASKAAKVESKTASKATSKAASKPASKPASKAAKAESKAASKAAKAESKAAKAESKAASKAASKAESKAASKAESKGKAAAKAESKTASKAAAPKAAKRGGRAKRKASKKAGKATPRGPRFVPQAFSGTNAPPGASPETLAALAAMQAEEAPKATRGRGRKTAGKGEAVSKKSDDKAAKSASCGCVTWTSLEGKVRGAAKHGTFVVEPEGKRHALYFYDADGQSRHLESGEPARLRKVAEEMAARGQPAPRTVAAGADDAALLRAFLGDDA